MKAAEDLRVPARDGFALAATLFEPDEPPLGAVLISPATAVRRQLYQGYAGYLAERGLAALTYDYRGIGGSRAGAPSDARMQHWGERDLAGAIDWLEQRYPGLPLTGVGHSVGGQLPGLADNARKLRALVGIAAQSGYWRLFPTGQWPRLLGAWYLAVPVCSALLGSVPGLFFGGEALPAGIARQWAHWCRHRDYICDDQGRPWRPHFDEIRCPARYYAIADDHGFAPLPAVQAIAGCYREAVMEVRVLQPQDYGLRAMGHFGYFRRGAPKAAWDETVDWLLQQVR